MSTQESLGIFHRADGANPDLMVPALPPAALLYLPPVWLARAAGAAALREPLRPLFLPAAAACFLAGTHSQHRALHQRRAADGHIHHRCC